MNARDLKIFIAGGAALFAGMCIGKGDFALSMLLGVASFYLVFSAISTKDDHDHG